MHICTQIIMTGTLCFCVSFKSQDNNYEYSLSGDHRTVGILQSWNGYKHCIMTS